MSDTHIGGTLKIATGAPATFDKAGYEALTWTTINGVVEAPAFASTHADIQIPSLGGRTKLRKGAETGVASSLAWETVASDAGQAAVIAASAARGEYSLCYINPDEDSYDYATGIVKDYSPNKPTNSSYEGGTAQFVPNYTPVYGAAAPA